MKNYLRVVAILTLVMAACSPSSKKSDSTGSTSAQPTSMATDTDMPMETPTATEEATDDMIADMETSATEMPMEMPTATDESTATMTDMEATSPAPAAYNGPDWANVELTNAETGEPFTLADFAGKTVYVEPMATWCTNCMRQQRTLKDIVGNFSPDEYVFISLSVETNISGQQLADYATTNGFTWLFAVSTPELLQTLINVYGNTVSNPPSTPHFILAPDGTASQLYSGYHDDAKLTAQLMG